MHALSKTNLAMRFAVILCMASSINSYAETYYVAATGNDSNSGTSENAPLRTIQKAVDLVKAGDLVLVKSGTYPGFFIRNKNGNENAWIVFKPYPGHRVILDPYVDLYKTAVGRGVLIYGSRYIEINGFEITDSNPARSEESREGIKTEDLSDGTPQSYIRILNNNIHHVGGSGIYTSYNSHHNEIIDNYIHHVGTVDFDHGMYLGGDDHVVRGNLVHEASGWGIHVYSSGGPTPDRNLVENNISYGNGGPGRVGLTGKHRGDGIIVIGGGVNNVIRNNICYKNAEWGIRTDSKNAIVVNNTVYQNGHQGIYVYDGVGAMIRNNISYGNRGENGYPGDFYIGTGNSQDHNLFSIDPKFVDAANGNFRLQVDSPAIDAGIAFPGFNTDIDSTVRPQIGGWDIGAHEFVVLSYRASPRPTITSADEAGTSAPMNSDANGRPKRRTLFRFKTLKQV